ncbi:hypothetical protein RND81_14G040000 [Saponaria officinalis]|uniref:Uncharacterized protein n=1 Tax=Saponaria officinalis TaxID=3572 RepID=A0AAW1GJ43_SAPOF
MTHECRVTDVVSDNLSYHAVSDATVSRTLGVLCGKVISKEHFCARIGTMALVSGVRSTLNPNAPIFIPAAFRQVEEYSPEWYDLITSSMWFRDYWLRQHQEPEMPQSYGINQDNFVANDTDFLPDDIDLGVDEELLNMESQFEEFIKLSGSHLQESKLLPKEVLATTECNVGFESQEKPIKK